MPKHTEKRLQLINYWNKHKKELCLEPSIKKVYNHYQTYATENNMEITNEYIFREYIRKNGYCNSCASLQEKKCKKCQMARGLIPGKNKKERKEFLAKDYIVIDLHITGTHERLLVLSSLLTKEQIDILRWADYDADDCSPEREKNLYSLVEYLESLNCDAKVFFDEKLGSCVYERPTKIKDWYSIRIA